MVRGPDARPAAGVEVRCRPERFPELPGDGATHEATGRTDADGRVRLPWPVGVSRVRVSAPGVGYGLTGVVEVTGGGPVRAPLPPLVPFAVLEGAVPADVVGPAPTVTASGGQPHEQVPATVEGGRFRAVVPAGRWEVTAAGNGRKAVLPAPVRAAPGQAVGGLVLRPPPPRPAGDSISPFAEPPGRGQTVVWATGTARDPAGRPVPGATVWGYATYQGGIRMGEIVRSTTTDRDGRYELKGDGGLSFFSVTLVAHRPGRPPAWAWLQTPDDALPAGFVGPPAPPRPPTVDLVLPDAGGRLEVTVERDGKPAAGVAVANEGVWLKDQWALGGDTPERQAVKAVVHPVVRTDESGRAAFDALLPGRYRVVAAVTEEKYVRQAFDWPDSLQHTPYGEAEGVPVAVGQTTARRLVVRPPLAALAIEAARPDSTRVNHRESPITYGRTDGTGGWALRTSVGLHSGSGLQPTAVGLWRVGFQYRDTPVPGWPLSGPPYHTADGVVAVSRLLPYTVDQPGWTREPAVQPAGALPPPRFTARTVEPGSLVVELRDVADRPARGFVMVESPGTVYGRGATDETGTVRFTGLMPYPVVVSGQLVGQPPADLGEYDGPLPDDAALTGRTTVTAVRLTPAPNAEARVVLRERPVGYVRATLRPPAGANTRDFAVYLAEPYPAGAGVHYRPSTGECVAGPFPAGEAQLQVFRHGAGGSETRTVAVTAGAVTRVDLRPDPATPLARDGGGLIGVGGVSHRATGADGLAGTVLLPDGKTPALGARLWYFEPGRPQPMLGGLTDALGRVRGKGLWYASGWPASGAGGGPLAVALLPGSHGAAVVPARPDRPFTAVLPASVAIRGRVTVGGAAPPPLGTVRVLAAYQGKGQPGGLADVRATAEPDGTFELAGLTADGIWSRRRWTTSGWRPAAVEVPGGGRPRSPCRCRLWADG
ncbi:MAG: hypothetical protein U0871_20760 [Gemmataceae bacterium]